MDTLGSFGEEKRRTMMRMSSTHARRMRNSIAVAWLALVSTFPTAGAAMTAADQPRAEKPPRVEGPLMQVGDTDCNRWVIRNMKGTDVAGLRWCRWNYRYIPGTEANAAEEYYIDWMQATLDPYEGFCVFSAEARVGRSPGDPSAVSKGYPKVVRRPGPTTISLAASAGGNAIEEGRVSQQFHLRPGRFDQGIRKFENHSYHWVSWKGVSRHPISLGLGVESASPVEAQAGVFQILTGVYRDKEVQSC